MERNVAQDKGRNIAGLFWVVAFILSVLFVLYGTSLSAQFVAGEVRPGAERTELYFPALTGKRVGVVANHASLVGNTHLVDTLISAGHNVAKIFSPEHGFRGMADAGQHLNDQIDERTGIRIVSLYGDNKEPKADQLAGLDVIVFDLQDVGVRFYTYISTLTFVMKACAAQNLDVIVLDRPNPNGHYIDGPVLENRFKSFVGLHNIPVVYGMTIGEYALMVNGEGWNPARCRLRIIPIENYDHTIRYRLPVKPSPNLPNMRSIYLYPSICFFEGTVVSIGRGTDKPFQVIGHPDYVKGDYQFIPKSTPGASLNPKLKDRTCTGVDLTMLEESELSKMDKLDLRYLLDFYKSLPAGKDFFTSYFNLLAGNATLKQQITEGRSEKYIRASWDFELDKFKKIREKYLLYQDFEERIELRK